MTIPQFCPATRRSNLIFCPAESLIFRNNVKAYGRPELAVGVVGSIGYYYSAELSDAAEAEGVALGCVVRSPMDGLVRYHS